MARTAPARTIRRLRAADELPLFSPPIEPERGASAPIVLADGDALLYRDWLPRGRADELAAELHREARWLQERRVMYDRVVDVPREQSWFGDNVAWYRDGYDAELEAAAATPGDRAGRAVDVRPWTPRLRAVRDDLQALVGIPFAYVLVNRYRDGRDSVAWHNDRLHPALQEPVIGSLSLGATRAFDIRAKDRPGEIVSVELAHGDLLVMRGAMQQRFDHRVRKDPRLRAERLNLTFRERPRGET